MEMDRMPDELPSESQAPSGAEEGGQEGAKAEHGAGETDGLPRHDGRRKAGIFNRVLARFIDILIALLFGALPGYIGLFAALTYIGIADGLMGGMSIGKRIIGLSVFNQYKGRAADFRDSVVRNSTVGLAYVLVQIPVLGWALAAAVLGFEFVVIIGSPDGKRLGDEMASTVVLDGAACGPACAPG